MEYRVAVGDRIFGIYKTKEEAREISLAASNVFTNSACRVVYKNFNTYKGMPVYMNGKEI